MDNDKVVTLPVIRIERHEGDDPLAERLTAFLLLVPTANWRHPPKTWGEQLREALNDRLVRVGFGGWLELTDAGRERIAAAPPS